MKKILFIILLVPILAFSQNYKFGWISDIHLGYPTGETDLDSVVSLINSFEDLRFVIASGDITEKGRTSELEKAKSILDQLNVPYYIIPGNHDTKWSESGTVAFGDIFGDDKFSFVYDSTLFIGINSGIPLRGGGGHFKPEDLRWFKKQLDSQEGFKEIFAVVHHPPDETIDNWFKFTNLLVDEKYSFLLTGHNHKNQILNFNGIQAAVARSTLSQNKESYGFTIVRNKKNSLFFYEIEKDTIPELWASIEKNDSAQIEFIDSTQFIATDSVEILWKKDLDYTLSSPLVSWQGKIYAVDLSGILTCFDSTGNSLWDYDAFGNVISRPAIADGIIAVGNVRGDLATLDAETGRNLLTIGFDEAITSQLVMINYKGSRQLMMPKQTNSNAAVVLGTASGKLYCYDLETLQELWVNESAGGMIESRPLYVENKLIFGSWDGFLYCIDARNGTLIWKWSENENFYYSPAASVPVTDGNFVFVSTPDKNVSAVDLLLGKTVWRKELLSWESIGISEDSTKLLIKSFKDKFLVVSTETGKTLTEYDLKFGLDTMPSEPIEKDGKILFGAKNGYIYLIQGEKAEPVIFTGTARVHTLQDLGNDKFAASNMDGKIIVFKLK